MPIFTGKQLCVRFFFALFLLTLGNFIHAQSIALPASARYLGVFAYSDKQADIFSSRVNPAALAALPQSSAGAYAERRFMLQELNLFNGAVGLNTGSGNFGVHASYFGFAQQNQSQLSLSYGRRITKSVDIGASFHYLQLSQSGIYGNANALTGSVGMLFHLANRVHIGVNAYNPIRAEWSKDEQERIPSRYSMGAGIDVSDKLFTGVEIIKEENQPVDVQAAIHYAFLPQFFVRGGVATQTSNYFAAVGFQLPAFRIDISGSYHQQLGWSPGILLLAKFGKNKSAESAINP